MKKYQVLSFLLVLSITAQSQNKIKTADAEFVSIINKPVKILQVNNNHFLIDFGKAFFGTLLIKAEHAQNDTLVLHMGEKLSAGRIDRSPPGTIRYQRVKLEKLYADKLHVINLIPDQRNTNPPAIQLPDSFAVVMPFRYCEIENLKIPIEDIQIWQKAFHYKFNDQASYFASSDKVLNAIWDLCKHSIKATSFAGMYIDGDRERIPYEADAYINQLSHYSVDSVYSLARRTNAYFLEHPTWPTEWILHTVLLFYYDYLYTGELQVLREHYDLLKIRTLMDLEREDGLISSKSAKVNNEFMLKLGFKNPKARIKDIVDWPPAQKDTGWKLATAEGERDGYDMVDINTVVNSFYYHNLILMSEIAGKLGNDQDSILFLKKSAQVKKSINQKLLHKSRGIYLDGEGSDHSSLHANMFPLAFDLVPQENIEAVVNFIKSRGMACSVYGAQYLLEGLFKNDQSDYAIHLITDTTHDRSWWNMIKAGSTITLEAWDIKYKPNLDWNHAWGTAPVNIITRYIWGITPKIAGFNKVRINPQLGNLSFSNIKVPTINGIIYAEYRRLGKKQKIYEIKLPENMEGQFIVPQKVVEIILNDRISMMHKEFLKLESGLNIVEIKY